MKVKYEEKTYEIYFNSELSQKAEIFFPLGQVQEGYFGFDAAFFIRNGRLWKKFNIPYPLWPFWYYRNRGVYLEEIAEEMEYFLKREIDSLPKIKTNLLFQYKKTRIYL